MLWIRVLNLGFNNLTLHTMFGYDNRLTMILIQIKIVGEQDQLFWN